MPAARIGRGPCPWLVLRTAGDLRSLPWFQHYPHPRGRSSTRLERMPQAPQDQIAPLLTPEGWELLASLGPYQEDKSFELNSALRKAGHSPALVSAVLTQSRLRTKAEGKFGEFARSMLFTQAGLEQATRLNVAARHAQRFAEAGVRHVADLGCGLGADSMALASLDIGVTAVELDET